jgi:hypothetical protein
MLDSMDIDALLIYATSASRLSPDLEEETCRDFPQTPDGT